MILESNVSVLLNTLIKSLKPIFFLFALSAVSSLLLFLFTFGNVNKSPIALTEHHTPTTRNGRVKPPSSYKAEPTAGPKLKQIFFLSICSEGFLKF